MPSPLPVTLTIGLSGSGKSSLIAHLCRQISGPIAAIGSGDERTPQACICCSGSELLHAQLTQRLAEHLEQPYKRLFIEGSDATDPVPVMRAIRHRFAATPLFLSEIVTAIDVTQFPPDRAPTWLVTNHIFFADRIALTHCDRATVEQIRACQATIQSVKGVPMVRVSPDLPAEELLRNMGDRPTEQ
ncbi:GTP-binding protein [Synechococcus sp. PCC 7336]|uniref:GTP-binding protein n=1 Tax=Synechococcus sp. PCC 7336 TaxID=195250 RepID=UPI00034BA6F4|nr:GTP-binding protein [Synechococcus sp. PCC 7336]